MLSKKNKQRLREWDRYTDIIISKRSCYKSIDISDDIKQKPEITPKWMNNTKYKISLDKFYTTPKIAEYCYKSLLSVAHKHNFDIENYTFLEPSAGNGSFFRLLPTNRRVGIDMIPECEGVIKSDFFDWNPKPNTKYITIGNPPFGLRGWLALAFINRIAEFSDLVGFILPMYFASDGKGSAKNRVKGLTLLHSEELPPDIYYTNGKSAKVNTVWQIWGKVSLPSKLQPTCDDFLDVFTVCTYHTRKCGLDKMDQYDCFIPSTFYSSKGMKICSKFEDVLYGSGYGLIIKKNKKEIIHHLTTTDWNKYSMRATNHCRHIGKSHIVQAITDGGFIDNKE